jgi:hypothetical protein
MDIHIDKNIGVSGAKIHWMSSKDGRKMYWCKMAIAIMGGYNMTDKEIATISPFDPRFQDNYVEGKGSTKEEAIINMEKEMKSISDSLWVI